MASFPDQEAPVRLKMYELPERRSVDSKLWKFNGNTGRSFRPGVGQVDR